MHKGNRMSMRMIWMRQRKNIASKNNRKRTSRSWTREFFHTFDCAKGTDKGNGEEAEISIANPITVYL